MQLEEVTGESRLGRDFRGNLSVVVTLIFPGSGYSSSQKKKMLCMWLHDPKRVGRFCLFVFQLFFLLIVRYIDKMRQYIDNHLFQVIV